MRVGVGGVVEQQTKDSMIYLRMVPGDGIIAHSFLGLCRSLHTHALTWVSGTRAY